MLRASSGRLFRSRNGFLEFSLQHQEYARARPYLAVLVSTLGLGIDLTAANCFPSATLKSPFSIDRELRLDAARESELSSDRSCERAIDSFVGRIEIPQIVIIVSEILERPGVFWIQTGGFLQVGSGFGPFALAALNRADGQINLGVVR